MTVNFVSDVTAGSETASYDSNHEHAHGPDSERSLDGQSSGGGDQPRSRQHLYCGRPTIAMRRSSKSGGHGVVNAATFNSVTSGGSGAALDQTHGLILTNGGKSVTLDISQAKTVEDLTNLINGIGSQFPGSNQRHERWHRRPFAAERCRFHDRRKRRHDGDAARAFARYNGATNLADLNRGRRCADTRMPSSNWMRRSSTISDRGTRWHDVDREPDRLRRCKTWPTRSTLRSGTTRATPPCWLKSTPAATAFSWSIRARRPPDRSPCRRCAGSQAAEYLGFISGGQTQATTSTTDGSGNYVLEQPRRRQATTSTSPPATARSCASTWAAPRRFKT